MILFIVTTESTAVQKHSETLEKYDYFILICSCMWCVWTIITGVLIQLLNKCLELTLTNMSLLNIPRKSPWDVALL